MKATYGEVLVEDKNLLLSNPPKKSYITEAREIFKAPVTDSGEKKSAKGLLCVYESLEDGKQKFQLLQGCSEEMENSTQNALKTVFINGKLIRPVTLKEVRKRLQNYLK